MTPDQFPKKTTTIEVGKTYFRVNSVGSGELFTPASKVAANAWPESTYYGPIDTTPSLIDLSHFDLSKIEPKKQPDKPGLWWVSNLGDGRPDVARTVTSVKLPEGHMWSHADWRFLCDFIPPRQSPVIPPLPTVKLYAVEQAGVVKWCHKSISGFWTADGLQAFGDPGAVPIAEKVAVVQPDSPNDVAESKPVIPPKPENVPHLMRLTKVLNRACDGNVGDMRWCVKDKQGDFRLINDSGSLAGIWWSKNQCEPVTE